MTETKKTKKALVAMSGGVDSSVVVHLVREMGYDVIGLTLALHENDSDIEDAKAVARQLNIPHIVVDCRAEFHEKVIVPFAESYAKGETPNPCVLCNRVMKFAMLYEKMKELDCDVMVTGHYARIREENGVFHLMKGVDEKKDQSYVLYSLGREIISHLLLPMGEYTKEEIRKIAHELNLSVADKKDSQDICFVPNGDYATIVCDTLHREFPKGDYIDRDGKKLGEHNGIVHYTVGQHKNLGLGIWYTQYVLSVNAGTNTVYLGNEEDLFQTVAYIRDFHWTEGEPEFPLHCRCKIRYKKSDADVTVEREGENLKLTFSEPQRAVTPGQSAVFYQGNIVLGGGILAQSK